MYEVGFYNEDGKLVVKRFESPYYARKFVIKLKHSKKLRLAFYPNFD